MRVGLIGDVHLSDRPPSLRTAAYADDILAKLRFAVETFNAEKVDAIVQAGDIFHIKVPSRTSHALVVKVADIFAESYAPVYIVPGNHDLQNDRIESIPTQPLGVLARMPNVSLLIGWEPNGLPLFGVPYLWDWKQLPKATEDWTWDEGARRLMVTHAPIFPPGADIIYDFIDAEDWSEIAMDGGYGSCYYGHIHDPHGSYVVGDALTEFCNNGALSRGSLHEATLKRKPQITLYDDSDEAREKNNGSDFTAILVPHKPIEEAFRLNVKEDADTQQQKLDDFLSSLASTTLDVVSVEAILAHVKELKLTPECVDELESCLEEAMK